MEKKVFFSCIPLYMIFVDPKKNEFIRFKNFNNQLKFTLKKIKVNSSSLTSKLSGFLIRIKRFTTNKLSVFIRELFSLSLNLNNKIIINAFNFTYNCLKNNVITVFFTRNFKILNEFTIIKTV
ncbi:protein of unknown function [Tenacibaculum aestuariivivum]